MQRRFLGAAIVLLSGVVASAQTQAGAPPQGARAGGAAPRLVLSVTSTSFPDGGEVPMRNAGRGENKSPAFEFHWGLANNPAAATDTLQSYAVMLHDVENSSNKGTAD